MLTVTKAATSLSREKKNTGVVENDISFPKLLTGKKIQNELDIHTQINEEKLFHPPHPHVLHLFGAKTGGGRRAAVVFVCLFLNQASTSMHGFLWLYALFLNQDPS